MSAAQQTLHGPPNNIWNFPPWSVESLLRLDKIKLREGPKFLILRRTNRLGKQDRLKRFATGIASVQYLCHLEREFRQRNDLNSLL